jgi:uncharacterized protein YjbJ (UPF0337 family)
MLQVEERKMHRIFSEGDKPMDWDQIAGKWSQIKGEIRLKWGRLTDDDLDVIAGSRDKLAGKIQELYGIVKEEAEQQIDEWCKSARPAATRSRHRVAHAGKGQAGTGEDVH